MTAEVEPDARVVLPRGRRYGVRALLVLGTLLAFLSVFAIWANRQLLDADNWADTSSQLLEESAIRGQVADYTVDQIYSNIDVAGTLANALPPRLAPLAGPAANALRGQAEKRMNKVLERPKVQQLWKEANRLTAQQFINIVEGNSRAITLQGKAVILNLRVIVVELAKTIGVPSSLVAKVPPNAGAVKVMESDQVDLLQKVVKALKGLGVILPILSFLCFCGAMLLAAGRRRRTLLFVGFDIIAAGLLALIVRRVLGNTVIDQLATTDAAVPAATAVWTIGTRMLYDAATALMVVGVPVVVAALVAGPLAPAVWLRRAIEPTLRDNPGVGYASMAALVLLILAWGPIPATRMPIPILVFAVLAAAATWALRRQTIEEFPDAEAGATAAKFKAWFDSAWGGVQNLRPTGGGPQVAVAGGPGVDAAVATPVKAKSSKSAAAAEPRDAAPAPVATDRVSQLERLVALRDQGILTDDELAAEKARILAAD